MSDLADKEFTLVKRILMVAGICLIGIAVDTVLADDLSDRRPWRFASATDDAAPIQSKRRQRPPGVRVAAGDECPAQSGAYCPDEAPKCCYVNSEWKCYAKLEDCVEQ